MPTNEHAVLSQTEIDNLIAQLSKATEKSYQEGFHAASEAVAAKGDNPDYTIGYNQGVQIGYERGISDAWDIIKKLISTANEEMDQLLQQSSIDVSKK